MSAGQVKAPPTARQFGYPPAPLHRIPYLSFPSSPFPHLPGQHKAPGAGEGPTRQATQCCSCHPGLPGLGLGGAPGRLLKAKNPLSLPGTGAPPRRHAGQYGDVPAVPQMGSLPCCHPYSSGGPCTSQRRHRSPSPTALPSKPTCSPQGPLSPVCTAPRSARCSPAAYANNQPALPALLTAVTARATAPNAPIAALRASTQSVRQAETASRVRQRAVTQRHADSAATL